MGRGCIEKSPRQKVFGDGSLVSLFNWHNSFIFGMVKPMLDSAGVQNQFVGFNGWVSAGQSNGQSLFNAQFAMSSGKDQFISPKRVEFLAKEANLPPSQKAIILQAYYCRPA